MAGFYGVMEAQGEVFLIREYVEGANLRFRFNPRPDLPQFLEVAVQCAAALAAPHEKGILHRDIKHENIILTTAGQGKLLYFGLAQRLRAPADPRATASQPASTHPLHGTRA